MFPSKLLLDKSSSKILVRFLMDAGIFPVNEFDSKAKCCKFCNFPEEAGMTPVKRLNSRNKAVKLTRFSNVGGI